MDEIFSAAQSLENLSKWYVDAPWIRPFLYVLQGLALTVFLSFLHLTELGYLLLLSITVEIPGNAKKRKFKLEQVGHQSIHCVKRSILFCVQGLIQDSR